MRGEHVPFWWTGRPVNSADVRMRGEHFPFWWTNRPVNRADMRMRGTYIPFWRTGRPVNSADLRMKRDYIPFRFSGIEHLTAQTWGCEETTFYFGVPKYQQRRPEDVRRQHSTLVYQNISREDLRMWGDNILLWCTKISAEKTWGCEETTFHFGVPKYQQRRPEDMRRLHSTLVYQNISREDQGWEETTFSFLMDW